jgi:hypothetical protein
VHKAILLSFLHASLNEVETRTEPLTSAQVFSFALLDSVDRLNASVKVD